MQQVALAAGLLLGPAPLGVLALDGLVAVQQADVALGQLLRVLAGLGLGTLALAHLLVRAASSVRLCSAISCCRSRVRSSILSASSRWWAFNARTRQR